MSNPVSGVSFTIEKLPIGRIFCFVPIRKANGVDVLEEVPARFARYFEPDQHAPIIGTMIAIVEERDVPGVVEALEELQQCAGPLGKLEAEDQLILDARRAPAHHVPD